MITIPELTTTLQSFSKYKDKTFRPNQGEVVQEVLESDMAISVISAPTGTGKSVIGAVLNQAVGDGIYLVHSKPLQQQLAGDFPEYQILQGRNNYPCLYDEVFDDRMADECIPSAFEECEHFYRPGKKDRYGKYTPASGDCPYMMQKEIVLNHPLRVLNYAYFLTECNGPGRFRDKPIVIADEADQLESALLSHIRLDVTMRMVEKYSLPIPPQDERWSGKWLDWVMGAQNRIANLVGDIGKGFDHGFSIKEQNAILRLDHKLVQFGNLVDETWLCTIEDNRLGERKWTFSPTWLTPQLTRGYFLDHAPQFVLMSATFPPKRILSLCLGIPECEMEYLQLPNLFPPGNRPIHILNSGDMGAKHFEADYPFVRKQILTILNNHPNDKGLIHSVSYKLRDLIMQINPQRMITHNEKDRVNQLYLFKNSRQPLVMVSPSMDRGVSLDGDEARFIIIAKAPFLSLGDRMVKARLDTPHIGRLWYTSMTIQTLEQMAGRGMRSRDDHCAVYCLDRHIGRIYDQNPTLFSNYWHESVRAGGRS